jgi:hypothetical protein
MFWTLSFKQLQPFKDICSYNCINDQAKQHGDHITGQGGKVFRIIEKE